MNIVPTQSRMYPRNQFVFCAYWRTWSRVLQYQNPGNNGQVEVNLTAINPMNFSEWAERVTPIVIRRHITARDRRDMIVRELPANVLQEMHCYVPHDVIERLLHEDFLPHIDWEKYNRHCNGGAIFDLIKKD